MSTPEDGLSRRARKAAASVPPSESAAAVERASAAAVERAPAEEIAPAEDVSHTVHPPHVTSPPGVHTTPPQSLAAPPLPPAAVEPPSPDVAAVAAESGMPGAHRGGFERWPTAPIGVEQTVGPIDNPETAALVQWAPAQPRAPYRGLAAWGLGFAIVALAVSTVVGWGFPIGLIAIVSALIAFRRPLESRAVATWALVLGIVSLFYSAGWLWFAASQADIFG